MLHVMSEEFGRFDAGADEQQWNEQSNEQVSEAASARVREWVANARKAAGQKAKSQRTNRQYALMLSFIFKYVDDEELLGFVYELTKENIHIISLFSLFLPYLQEKMDISPYKPLYSDVWDNLQRRVWSEESVIEYYRELLDEFPQLQQIDRKRYIYMVRRWWVVKNVETLKTKNKNLTDEVINARLYEKV